MLRSYATSAKRARKNAPIFRRDVITKPIRLVDRLKKVFHQHSERMGNLVQAIKRGVFAFVYILANLLFRNTYQTGKSAVGHLFFSNTSYSRSCDSYFFFSCIIVVSV